MRRVWLSAALVLVADCGGSPSSPSAAARTPRPVILDSGAYTLTLTFSASGSPSFCIGTPQGVKSQYAVTVARSGEDATASVSQGSGSLVLTLKVSATAVSGTIDGSVRGADDVTVSVRGNVTGAVPADASAAVAGSIDGQMTVPGGSCTNNTHGWALTPR